MQYSRLGNTGLVISRLAFGAMTFGSSQGATAAVFKLNQATADRLTGQALDAGVTYFNTADVYADGQSETMLGRALGDRRKDVVIASKVGGRTGQALVHAGLSRRHILEGAEASLRRLGTDYIDVYLAHKVDPTTPLEETLEAFDQLVREGKVRYVGFSNWPAWLAAKAVGLQKLGGHAPFCAAELYYSLLGRDIEYELVPFTQDAGIGITVWSPLAGGFLSGRYTREDPSGGGGRRATFQFIPVDEARAYDIVDVVRDVATELGATPAQVALAWLLAKTHVVSVLVGASSETQLVGNLAAARLFLPEPLLKKLDGITATSPLYPGWFHPKASDGPLMLALQDGRHNPSA